MIKVKPLFPPFKRDHQLRALATHCNQLTGLLEFHIGFRSRLLSGRQLDDIQPCRDSIRRFFRGGNQFRQFFFNVDCCGIKHRLFRDWLRVKVLADKVVIVDDPKEQVLNRATRGIYLPPIHFGFFAFRFVEGGFSGIESPEKCIKICSWFEDRFKDQLC